MSMSQPCGAKPRGRRLWYPAAVGVLGLVLLGGGQPPGSAPPAVSPPPAQAAASPLDEPLRLIALAQEAYRGVRDYTCTVIKRETVNGAMTPDHVIDMKVRTQPFSVYLHWQRPAAMAGQEVCYVAGRNDGKMRVHPTGVWGVVGFVSLDPDDPRAKQASRRNITEAGIGNLIERFARAWEAERHLNVTQVKVAEYEYNRRRCTRVETIQSANPQGQFQYYRCVVYFDKETHLPIRLECYDWPRRQGDAGQLAEVYSFAHMRLNVGLGDEVFNH
jgi:hypothetical protein